jgi:trigger factor
MLVTQTYAQGLKREFKVVLAAADLAERVEGQLIEVKAKAHIPGFRPGKVPVSHLRRLYGRSIMAEVVQNAITEANHKIIEDNQLRLAMDPKVDFPGDGQEIEKVFQAQADLDGEFLFANKRWFQCPRRRRRWYCVRRSGAASWRQS